MAAYVRSRAWCFTYQLGFTADDPPNEKTLVSDELYMVMFNGACPTARYCIFQRESGVNTGNIHLQGFVYFDNKKSAAQMHAMHFFGPDDPVWFTTMHPKSSIAKNIVYCSKDDTGINGGRMAGHSVMESGERPHQGARNDIPDVIAYMVENPTLSWTQIAQAEPRVANMMRYKPLRIV